jgi:uncharacterized protein YndB with AHSA1/START domain
MKTIHQTYEIKAPIEKVWEALVDPKVIEKWSGATAKMDDKEGFKFELWDNEIFGTNTEVIKEKKLVQEWYDEKDGKPTTVTFTLNQKDDTTTLELLHQNVPEEKFESLSDGWNGYYLGEIKKLLEK